jgi:serpin B
MLRVKQLVLVWLVLVLVAGQFIFTAPPVYACSCMPPGAPRAEMAQAAAVFAGRVTDVKAPGGLIISSADPTTVTFAVSHVWKGPEESVLVVKTARDSASCGFPFQTGQEYLVYAFDTGAELTTHLCSRTAFLADAREDLAALGEGQAPAPAATESAAPTTTWWWRLSLILLSIFVSAILYLLWHHRGRSQPGMLWLLLPLLAPLTACAPAREADGEPAASALPRQTAPAVAPDELRQLVAGNNSFAFDLYQALRQEEDGNLFYSPYSISIALAMTYAGARDETERQMAQTLHYRLGQAALHPTFNALDQQLTGTAAGGEGGDGTFHLSIANSLWGQEGFPWRQEYLDTIALNYGAGLHLVDYTNDRRREEARQAINHWVAEETEDKIRDLIAPGILDDLTRLVLANAIYFKGEWEQPFDGGTRDGDFQRLDGRIVTVPMMSRRSHTRIATGAGYQAVELTYKGERAHMIVLLPEVGHFESFAQELTAVQLEQIIAALETVDLNLTMPKFTFAAEFSLGRTLVQMGMPDAFDDSAADFAAMYVREQEPRRLFITHVIHKAFVAVDEIGTEAAAATAVVMGIESMPELITVDRPFLFVIRDLESGTILFVGRVLDPLG